MLTVCKLKKTFRQVSAGYPKCWGRWTVKEDDNPIFLQVLDLSKCCNAVRVVIKLFCIVPVLFEDGPQHQLLLTLSTVPLRIK
jgi:hypothetical protein